jgi:metal-responsive CopG/Arc/MetJ family transcriptional regulator
MANGTVKLPLSCDILSNMKTIAISIDEDILERVDRLAKGREAGNRSRVIREAVHEYVSRLERATADEREAAIVRRHRGRLARQASALVREQAKP